MNGTINLTLRGLIARSASSLGSRATRSPWRRRLGLLTALGALLVANAAVLVTYNAFYDARFQALTRQRAELEKSRDAARSAAEKVRETDRRLTELKSSLETFYGDVLGSRKERLAPLIEDIHSITRKAGLVPGSISYAEEEVPSAQRIALTFRIQGRYADVKKLLYAFESNPRFLVLEGVSVAVDEAEPGNLKINLIVAHYFRGEAGSTARRPFRATTRASGASRPAATAAASPTE